MDLQRLQLAARLGGTVLHAAGAVPLLVAERLHRHGAPQLLVLCADPDLAAVPLAAAEAVQGEGLDLNLQVVLDPGPGLAETLRVHRNRIGALLGALEALPNWPGAGPMLARRLPGRIRAATPQPMSPAPLGPLERAQLEAHFPDQDAAALAARFVAPPWTAAGDAWEAPLWPEVPVPAEASLLWPGLTPPTATPMADALRAALRAVHRRPVPLLPLERNPAGLRALASLVPEVQCFHGGDEAWRQALRNLAALPAPPHFCARC